MLKNPSSILPDRGRVSLDFIEGKSGQDKAGSVLTIALSVQAKEFPERFSWAEDNAFALEYTPDPLHPEIILDHTMPFARHGTPVRFHTRFFDHEMGNSDPGKAVEALLVHLHVIDAISELDQPVVTVHLNLNRRIPFNSQIAEENLTRLVEYAKEHSVTVCLENLRRGLSSDPANILTWVETSGAMITLDVGHAVSSEVVREGKISVPEIVDRFHERLYEVHMYAKEEDRHYPIEDIVQVSPVIDHLLRTGCSWWTIELDDRVEAMNTRQRLLDYLSTKQTNKERGEQA